MAGKLAEAIGALVQALKGGTAPAPAPADPAAVQGAIQEAISSLTGTPETPVMGPAPEPAPPPEPAPKPTKTKLMGDDLMGKLDAEGAALTSSKELGPIGVRSGEGIGGQIGGDETVTFTAGETVDGARVKLTSLWADPADGGGQEKATIDVVRDGEVVDTLTVSGDLDGKQKIAVDQAFDQLVFRTSGEGSDFAIERIATLEEAEAPEPVEDAADAAPAESLSALQAANADEIVALLQNVLALIQLVVGSEASEAGKADILAQASAIVEAITDGLSDGALDAAELQGLTPMVSRMIEEAGVVATGGTVERTFDGPERRARARGPSAGPSQTHRDPRGPTTSGETR